ncbi:MAG: sigma 54-interacting transcriptional regulator [Thermodesulfobacteriota bacterium]|nr:sigma 54-interacting transcriptional regulator [Thermodesulfobacteriota bacterium]
MLKGTPQKTNIKADIQSQETELLTLKEQLHHINKTLHLIPKPDKLKEIFKIIYDAIIIQHGYGICLVYEPNDTNSEFLLNFYFYDTQNWRYKIREVLGVDYTAEKVINSEDTIKLKQLIPNSEPRIIRKTDSVLKFIFKKDQYMKLKQGSLISSISSLIIIPLTVQKKISRIMIILTPEEFKEEELQRVKIFAKQAELALERTKLLNDVEERNKELEVLFKLAKEIGPSMDLEVILGRVIEGVNEIIAYDVCSIGLLEETRKRFEIYKVRGMTAIQEKWFKALIPERSEDFILWATSNKISEPTLVDAGKNPPPLDSREFRYFLNVPLISENRLIGIITIGTIHPYRYPEKSIKILAIMASQIAGLIEKAMLYQKNIYQKEKELTALSQEIKTIGETYKFSNLIGKNHQMQDIFQTISSIADTDVPVLIQGETGTGKEMVARAIHFNSNRQGKPYIKLNCGSIPEQLFESEMFGHIKGSFTGAYQDRTGKFLLADSGTLFLDEIGEIPLSLQVKMLRILQDMEFEPVGSNKTKKVDVRIIAATNQDLERAVSKGNFRSDLFFRLNVVTIKIPSLRERTDDILLLAVHFLKLYSKKHQKDFKEFSREGMKVLISYSWPGNVRELENVIERAVLMGKGRVIKESDLQISPETGPLFTGPQKIFDNLPFKSAKKEQERIFEREYLKNLLIKYQGSIKKTSEHAGINRKTLYLKMKRYGLKKRQIVL